MLQINKGWAGVDEVGRGCIAGPVTACALMLHHDLLNDSLTDSKKLSEKQREALFDSIVEISTFKVIFMDAQIVDDINILQATLRAMHQAITHIHPVGAYIDGNKCPDNLSCPAEAIIKGDSLIPAISAASIIAKVTRDRYMKELAEEYPEYGFERHKGYGTRAHLEALEKYGITPYHRKSFAPVKKLCL